MTIEEIDQLPAGVELDALIHQYVFGQDQIPKRMELVQIFSPYREDRYVENDSPLPFSKHIGLAWLVLEKLKKEVNWGIGWTSVKDLGEGWYVWDSGEYQFLSLSGPACDSAPLAICRAVLRRQYWIERRARENQS